MASKAYYALVASLLNTEGAAEISENQIPDFEKDHVIFQVENADDGGAIFIKRPKDRPIVKVRV